MKVNDLIMKELSEKKYTELFLQLRKDSAKFDDLCETRDSYVRMLEPHIVVSELLKVEIEKWDKKLDKVFDDYVNSKTQA